MNEELSYLEYFWYRFLEPFAYPIMSGRRIYWLYVLTALLLAALVFLRKSRQKGFSIKEFLKYCFPRSIYTHRSAINDYIFFVINAITFPLLIAPSLLTTGYVSSLTQAFSSQLLSSGFHTEHQLLLSVIYTLAIAASLDFAIFFSHYLQHMSPILWEFHKVHHSAEVLTPMTVYRMHPVDDILNIVCLSVFSGIVDGVFQALFPGGVTEIRVYHVNVIFFVFYIAANLRHSHVWLSYGRFLNNIFISPAQHQIHHSQAERHWDKNFGFIFAFWDRMFGSLYVPEKEEDLEYGVSPEVNEELRNVGRLYFVPFRRAAQHLIKKFARKQEA